MGAGEAVEAEAHALRAVRRDRGLTSTPVACPAVPCCHLDGQRDRPRVTATPVVVVAPQIAKALPGRTDNAVKNHWNSTLRRKYQAGDLDNDFLIGQPSLQALLARDPASRGIGERRTRPGPDTSPQPPRRSLRTPAPSAARRRPWVGVGCHWHRDWHGHWHGYWHFRQGDGRDGVGVWAPGVPAG